MKKNFLILILLGLPACPNPASGATVKIEMDEYDKKIVEIYDEDAEQFMKTTWSERVANKRARLINDCVAKLRREKKAIPADDDKIIRHCMENEPEFRPRKVREKEAQNKN